MTSVSAIMEKQEIFEAKTTLVRRVSDLFKADGNSSVSPLLLNHTSMQKLRHCCQSLNLFPSMLYSFDQRKGQLIPMSKVNLAILMSRIAERIYRVYSSLIFTIIRGLGLKSMKSSVIVQNTDKLIKPIVPKSLSESKADSSVASRQNEPKFKKFVVQKPKSNPLFFKLAVYLAPLFLAFKLIGLFTLMILSEVSPGFVFLFTALVLLGCISMKILKHDVTAVQTLKHDKRKDD
ncbi:uncharacterized protein [Venturia canescens]|nr:uncharacterized protein LOC122413325 isoform X2 [Venturia canescens]